MGEQPSGAVSNATFRRGQMRTITQSGEHELEVKKSRFRCALARVTDEAQAREFIQQRRKLHHDARHHCSAFVLGDLGEIQKSSDDGEPAGTAGVPMLEVLRHNEVTNAVAVVTRYFGGVLLGAGGLVRAYGGAVSAALEHVRLVERRPVRTVTTEVDYLLAGKLDNDLRSAGYQVVDTEYQDVVRFHVNVPVSEVDAFGTWLAETTGGTAEATPGALTYAEVAF
ncbi:uncharacterized protein, YigZ family [Saccharopolyspora antimicrobica]|uniref:Uncharacterized protein, YigZ family n=2 Tax=Saccharopolyspora antimicrobica TaxID=455193 RepID=A0A1I4QAR4_9PSEU|nr:putative YigZ family protein [Saccharopolyspora antimicrobica]SFM36743.1 uncharacterized protein, YigZ family [Saccharopolyspora antimicrobica]